jgi:hypothetical protein
MNVVTPRDIEILMNFQKARFGFLAFHNLESAVATYHRALKDLQGIKQPALASLVKRMTFESTSVPQTEEEHRQVVKEVDAAMAAEAELYRLSFYFGDAIPAEGMKQ